ncbi:MULTISPECIES: porin [unclassified Shimia]|uniref:porin n=1 Tax=unclassified Shimia TaxID=2630038 RepID=UPI0031067700
MKKILFATTALVATASVAAAELAVSGSARFGLTYEENRAEETILEQRIRINFTGIAETDGGVKFEARIRLESNEGFTSDAGNSTSNGSTGVGPGAVGFAVSTGGLRVDVGSVSDVLDSGDHFSWGGTGVGFTGFIEQNSNKEGFIANGFSGAGNEDANTVKVLYSAGDFAVSASYTEANDLPAADADAAEENFQVGASYSFGAHKVGLAYGSSDSSDQWVLGAGGSFGDFGYNVIVGDNDAQDDILVGASGSYAISAATTLVAAVSTGGDTANDTSFGIGVNHSLGGGVTLGAGVGSNAAGNTAADLGVKFSF